MSCMLRRFGEGQFPPVSFKIDFLKFLYSLSGQHDFQSSLEAFPRGFQGDKVGEDFANYLIYKEIKKSHFRVG